VFPRRNTVALSRTGSPSYDPLRTNAAVRRTSAASIRRSLSLPTPRRMQGLRSAALRS
jgi:hypothetical protein